MEQFTYVKEDFPEGWDRFESSAELLFTRLEENGFKVTSQKELSADHMVLDARPHTDQLTLSRKGRDITVKIDFERDLRRGIEFVRDIHFNCKHVKFTEPPDRDIHPVCAAIEYWVRDLVNYLDGKPIEQRKFDTEKWEFPQIEEWFNEMLKTGRPVIISDEQAYKLMTQVDSAVYKDKPYEFARAKLDAYLIKRGYKHQGDFFMRETKACHLYLLRKYITEHAVDGVFTVPDSMLDDWNINLTQLHTSCYAAKVRMVIPGRECVPRNDAMYDYIAKFPFGAKVPYTRELLEEFKVSSHKFGKACARHGKGVCKCKSLPL